VNEKLNEVSCASLPVAGLPSLADIRCVQGVQAAIVGDRAWLRWPPGAPEVLLRVLPVSGAELYIEREGCWYRFGSRLPAPGWPAHAAPRPLHVLLTPVLAEPEPISTTPLSRCLFRLKRDPRPHPATALRCNLQALAAWAEHATTAGLNALAGVCSGDAVVLRGDKLPVLPGSQRYWGERVLVPLGYRPDPALADSALLTALDADNEMLALLDVDGVELLPLHAFESLTRAGVRMALAERA
jgi:hypothetical protein